MTSGEKVAPAVRPEAAQSEAERPELPLHVHQLLQRGGPQQGHLRSRWIRFEREETQGFRIQVMRCKICLSFNGFLAIKIFLESD